MQRAEKLAREVISDQGLENIAAAIRSFENRTSGEIVISFNTRSGGQPYKRTRQIFKQRKLHHTRERNGILIALFLEEHSFAVYGDTGIHERVSADYWESTVAEIARKFRKETLAEGLVWAIHELGARLTEFFPAREDDVNELSDDLRFEDDP